jgi:ectoine hydroxylase-related dioxygenase (phytanoyl-CoA dioxygenase family)
MVRTSELHADFAQKGFSLHSPIMSRDLVSSAIPHIEKVMMGIYETGIAPIQRNWNPGDDPHKLRKIDQAHRSDEVIRKVVMNPAIGRLAAQVMNAQWIQLWATQLLYKPAGGQKAASVGWHQDIQYWKDCWEGEVFTAWLAITDVPLSRGPVIFVPGSHRWGQLENTSFWETDLSSQHARIHIPPGEQWKEEPGILEAGGISFHHSVTLHGSGPNVSGEPRIGLALHLRTERSTPKLDSKAYPVYTASYMPHLDDPAVCPVLWDAQPPGK